VLEVNCFKEAEESACLLVHIITKAPCSRRVCGHGLLLFFPPRKKPVMHMNNGFSSVVF
jgi:hypothetical protein